MSIFIGIVGILLVLGLAYLLSNDKKGINFKAIGILMLIQVALTLGMFKTTVGTAVVEAVSNGVSKVLNYGFEGVNFVVGGWIPEGVASVFFVNVLLIIVFTSALLSVLTHIKVLPTLIKFIGGALSKITGLSNVVTFNSINSIFFGQSEALLAIKDHIHKMNDNKLFVVSVAAMGSVSAGIMGAYMTMIPSQYVLSAMVLNALSGLVVASIVAPSSKEENEIIDIKGVSTTKNIFEAISAGALDGGKVALIVGAMLIAYVGLIALIDAILVGLIGLSFTQLLGYIFSPVALIMGIPSSEIVQAGSVMGTKLATNEFVAMLQFQPMIPDLTTKTVAIVSTFLVSFANFSSIGIISGSMQAISGEKAAVIAGFGLKMLLVATMVSVFTATIVGIFA
ncbi:NupC/NupG family nucleoside CNT transporter [Bacillus sp. BGMRC 2118]|nr:NupC/NupG family nucleoside CNT transporter [Bacillus sp. BGMRC 2118]